MTTFISIRVSTREQARDGTSLPSQVRECLAYCKYHDFDLHPTATNVDEPGVFCDPGVSAWKVPIFQRPGFQKLWHHVNDGDRIVFLSFDRAFRSTRDFLNSWEILKSRQVMPTFVRNDIRMDTAAGQLWARTVASFAEYQSAIISERVREANAIRKLYGTVKSTSSRQKSRQSVAEVPESILRITKSAQLDAAPSKTGRVFAYGRISTLDQDVKPQILRLEQGISYRIEQGRTRGGLFVDEGVSAFFTNFMNRPAGRAIFDQLQPGDVILCTKLDRMFRSTLDMARTLELLKELQVHIAAIDGDISTETPEGQAIASYLCIMAQWESQSISWRTKMAMDSIREVRGPWLDGRYPRWVNAIPTGSGHRIEVNPVVVRDAIKIRELHDSGLTVNRVSDIMQRVHEEENNFPVPVPRSGFESRQMLENRTRSKGRFDDLRKIRDYCEKFGIGLRDPIDRHYSIQDYHYDVLLAATSEDGLLTKYLNENDGNLETISEAAECVG